MVETIGQDSGITSYLLPRRRVMSLITVN